MRTPRVLLLLPVAVILACTDPIPVDTLGDPASNVAGARGGHPGSVLYQDRAPCSTGGHIVGSAVVLLFDQNNPPPPNGLANTAVNFTEVPGDVLFANEPRWGGSDTYCPTAHGFEETITASAPFAVSPLAPAAYLIEAFYDTEGHFLPTFKFRNLPEQGDVGGGAIDTADALKPINAVNPDYQPVFLPVGVGTPQPVPPGSPPGTVPLYSMPSDGFLADNVQVSMGEVLSNTRPYVYAQGVPRRPGHGHERERVAEPAAHRAELRPAPRARRQHGHHGLGRPRQRELRPDPDDEPGHPDVRPAGERAGGP